MSRGARPDRTADRPPPPGGALLVGAALATAAGTGLRGLGGIAPLHAGTQLAGAAIALSQVLGAHDLVPSPVGTPLWREPVWASAT